MKSLLIGLMVTCTLSQAHAFNSLSCTLDAAQKVRLSVGVDEAYGSTEVVLFGMGWNSGSGVEKKTQSAILPIGSTAKQLNQGSLVIAFGDDAKDSDKEVYDSTLVAVRQVENTNIFKGYISQYDDGVASMAITCEAK